MSSIAVDFGGSNIKIGIIDGGKIQSSMSIPAFSENGLAPRLASTRDAVYELVGNRRLLDFKGVGIAMPGIVDPKNKKVLALYKKYEDSKDINLEKWCLEAFGLDMIMEMDSKAALMGEMHYGCAKGYKDVALLIIGTGVGTAVAIDGKLLTSRNYQAGALASHIIVELDGYDCTCPNKGCVEATASGWAINKIAKEHPLFHESALSQYDFIDFKRLIKHSEDNDYLAKYIFDRCTEVWRAEILNLIHAYDAEVVILSGAVMGYSKMLSLLTNDLHKRIWHSCGEVKIVKANMPENSVLLGLGYLVDKMVI